MAPAVGFFSSTETDLTVPGSRLLAASEIAVPPLRPSKRVIRLSEREGPPTLSHGIHTLYESPRSLEL